MATIRIEGADKIAAALASKQEGIAGKIEDILMAGAEIIRQAAADNTDGKIAANMTKERLSDSRPLVGIGPSKREWYAKFIEFGAKSHSERARRAKAMQVALGVFRKSVSHPGMGAKPFLRPALDENIGEAQEQMGKQVKEVLDL